MKFEGRDVEKCFGDRPFTKFPRFQEYVTVLSEQIFEKEM